MLRPPYFTRIEQYNKTGPPPLNIYSPPKLFHADDFERQAKLADHVILDTRGPGAFASSHIPGSLNIWLEGVGFYPGWILSYEQTILLVTERKEDVETATTYLQRLGYDRIEGYLCRGIAPWRNQGKPFESLGVLSASSLREKMLQDKVILVDVRDEEESKAGHIEGSQHIYIGHLDEKAGSVPSDKPIATICSWGGRGGIAASVLKRRGFKSVSSVLGGVNAWRRLGYPLIEGP